MISIVLVEPESSGNIGSIARIMANFDFKELILVNPKCNHLDGESLMFALHAETILKHAKVVKTLPGFDLTIATTSRLGSDYNIQRSPISAEDIAKKLSSINGNIGLVFGRESSGLTNREIAKCDFTVTIPTSNKYAAMNIAQAVNIMLYEVYKYKGKNKIGKNIHLATKIEKDILIRGINKRLDSMQFTTSEKRETQKILWKKIVGKSFLTKRELFSMHGFFRK